MSPTGAATSCCATSITPPPIHGFIAALAAQSRALGWELVQLDPPHRAWHYFRHNGRLRSVLPDAFIVLRREGKLWPCFVEWERRAVRPSTMAAKLAPNMRYYASPRPTDDHGARPTVLVVFSDELAAHHFLRVAREEVARTGVELPLCVADHNVLEREGRLGPAWLTPGIAGGGSVPSRATGPLA